MDVEQARLYCLSKPASTESFPFDETSLVVKVLNKIFAIISLDVPPYISLKCEPDFAISLREQHSFIQPGYHLAKKQWNSIALHEAPDELLISLIDHSCQLVVSKLPRKIQSEIK